MQRRSLAEAPETATAGGLNDAVPQVSSLLKTQACWLWEKVNMFNNPQFAASLT